jgi:predicted flap endonuclease-1-like 5' DNA nuclease
MADNYYIDLEGFSLERFKEVLETKELLPGRVILKEELDERFGLLASMGINNLQELWDALKTKKRVAGFADESGLSQEYLVVLRREVGSYIPEPVNLSALPDIEVETIERLAGEGIKNTKHLFDRAKTKRQRAELSEELDIPPEDMLELVKLSDLVRIVGVGPVFARILYEAGVDRLGTFVAQSPDELLAKTQDVIASKGYPGGNLREEDIIYCLETANLLPQVVEYE